MPARARYEPAVQERHEVDRGGAPLNAPVTPAAIANLNAIRPDASIRLSAYDRFVSAGEPAGDRRHGDRIGGEICAERECGQRGSAGTVVHQIPTATTVTSTRPRRQQHRAQDREQVALRNNPAVGEQQRGNEQQEEDLGRDPQRAEGGHEGQPDAGRDLQQRQRDRDPFVDRAHHGDREQQPQRDLDDAHAANCTPRSVDFSLERDRALRRISQA